MLNEDQQFNLNPFNSRLYTCGDTEGMTKEESEKLGILCKDAPKVNVVVIVAAILASMCFLCYIGVVICMWMSSNKR